MRKLDRENTKEALDVLNKGGILALPTETVYGLAVKANNQNAINKLLKLKERPIKSGKVLTMMLADVDQMEHYAVMNKARLHTARHYFPGELTLILPRAEYFKHPYFSNFENIGIRIPQHQYMLKLLRHSGPLLVTSANLRGEAPCFDDQEVSERLAGIDAVVRGQAGGNLPSTIIDLTESKPRIIRQGGLLVVHY